MSERKGYDPLANLGRAADVRRGEAGQPTGLRIGDLAYWDGVKFERLPAGANQYVLTAGGAGVAPAWAAAAGGAPTGAAGGDLGGTYPNPTVTHARGIRETSGPTTLVVGEIADGEYVRRVGAALVGGTPGGGSGATITHGTHAGAPASPTNGDLHKVTGAPYYRSREAGAWVDRLSTNHMALTMPGPASGWTALNGGTIADREGGVRISSTASAVSAENLRCFSKGTFTSYVQAVFSAPPMWWNYSKIGVFIRDSSTGRISWFGLGTDAGDACVLIQAFSSFGVYGGASNPLRGLIHADTIVFRLEQDATYKYGKVSLDGGATFHTVLRMTRYCATVDGCGIVINSQNDAGVGDHLGDFWDYVAG